MICRERPSLRNEMEDLTADMNLDPWISAPVLIAPPIFEGSRRHWFWAGRRFFFICRSCCFGVVSPGVARPRMVARIKDS